MATQTRVLGKISDAQVPPHYATLSIAYDDVTLLLSSVTIANDTNRTARVIASLSDGSHSTTFDVAAGQTQTLTIPAPVAAFLHLTVTANGRLDGVQYSFMLL